MVDQERSLVDQEPLQQFPETFLDDQEPLEQFLERFLVDQEPLLVFHELLKQLEGDLMVKKQTQAPAVASAPDVPASFEPLDGDGVKRLRKPVGAQLSSALSVAGEVEGSKTFADDFGKRAVAAGAIATELRAAAAWSAEAARAERWSIYAKNQALLAWDAALGTTDGFKKDYDAALGHEPALADSYPELNEFVTAKSSVAKRGGATRKANKKATKGTTGT